MANHLRLVRKEEEEPTTEMAGPAGQLSESFRGYLLKAVEQLPEDERYLVQSHYFDGCTLEEVGEDLDMDEDEIRQLHASALKLLRNVSVLD